MTSIFSQIRRRISNQSVLFSYVEKTDSNFASLEKECRIGPEERGMKQGDTPRSQETLATQKRLNETDDQVSRLQEENWRLKERISAMARTHPTNARHAVDLQEAERRVEELETANRQNLKKLQDMEKRYAQLEYLLEQRTSELRDAQEFLNKPDEYPGSTILKKVEGVNSEIFNTAATINDLFEGSKKLDEEEKFVKEEFLEGCRTVAKRAIGNLLYRANCQIDEAFFKRDPINPEESMPLQLALQSLLVKWAKKVVGDAGSFPGDDGGLKRAYELIRSREEKSISSQWRVITYRRTKHLGKSFKESVTEEIMSVLCICGLSTSGPNCAKVLEKVHRRVENLEKMLLSLAEAIHEGITSSDMELVSVDTGTAFDPQTMTDLYSADTKSKNLGSMGSVLCTIGLGLKKTTMKRVADVQVSLLQQTEFIKQPEVALVELLEDFKLPEEDSFDQHVIQKA